MGLTEIIGSIAALLIIALIVWVVWRRIKANGSSPDPEVPESPIEDTLRRFEARTLGEDVPMQAPYKNPPPLNQPARRSLVSGLDGPTSPVRRRQLSILGGSEMDDVTVAPKPLSIATDVTEHQSVSEVDPSL